MNPILDWTYGHTWHFLRLFQIPYCSLYDEGYTSLGNLEDTERCPALLKVNVDINSDASSPAEYWPAYMLQDWDQERAGRLKKESKKKKSKSNDSTTSTTSTTATIATIPPTMPRPAINRKRSRRT